jgi:hypothetical protein
MAFTVELRVIYCPDWTSFEHTPVHMAFTVELRVIYCPD